MLTVGVDLAAEPERTAVAWIDWSSGRALVRDLALGADDDLLVDAIGCADKVGIDCPLGWPRHFVAFLAAHQAGELVVPEDFAGKQWRRQLAWRTTDRMVRQMTGRDPLSVSADRIGHTAMRCAGLLAQLARTGQPVDRTGTGIVVEVYPAASLHLRGLPYRGYKCPANLATRTNLLTALTAAAPWLALGQHDQTCQHSDDALDAVIAAVTARAAALALTTPPRPEHLAAARVEGWIALPNTSPPALEP